MAIESINLGWPQSVFIFLMVWAILKAAAKDGENIKHSMWGLVKSAIGLILHQSLFIWGGFYSMMGGPQIIIIVLYSIGVLASIFAMIVYGFVSHEVNREPRTEYNISRTVIVNAVVVGLLILGGFFSYGI